MIPSGITADAARNEFLTLLVTQLRHQDPLDPIGQQDFLSQLAQFSTLEGIEKLNANFEDLLKLQELTEGADLLGRTVLFDRDVEGAAGGQGVVDAVITQNNNLFAIVGGEAVPIHNITGLAA